MWRPVGAMGAHTVRVTWATAMTVLVSLTNLALNTHTVYTGITRAIDTIYLTTTNAAASVAGTAYTFSVSVDGATLLQTSAYNDTRVCGTDNASRVQPGVQLCAESDNTTAPCVGIRAHRNLTADGTYTFPGGMPDFPGSMLQSTTAGDLAWWWDDPGEIVSVLGNGIRVGSATSTVNITANDFVTIGSLRFRSLSSEYQICDLHAETGGYGAYGGYISTKSFPCPLPHADTTMEQGTFTVDGMGVPPFYGQIFETNSTCTVHCTLGVGVLTCPPHKRASAGIVGVWPYPLSRYHVGTLPVCHPAHKVSTNWETSNLYQERTRVATLAIDPGGKVYYEVEGWNHPPIAVEAVNLVWLLP